MTDVQDEPKTQRFILDVGHDCEGACEGHTYAIVEIDYMLAERLLGHMKTVKELARRDYHIGFAAYKICLNGSPAYYYPGDPQRHNDNLGDGDATECDEVSIYDDYVRFTARPQYSSCNLETDMVGREELEKIVRKFGGKQLELPLVMEPDRPKKSRP